MCVQNCITILDRRLQCRPNCNGSFTICAEDISHDIQTVSLIFIYFLTTGSIEGLYITCRRHIGRTVPMRLACTPYL